MRPMLNLISYYNEKIFTYIGADVAHLAAVRITRRRKDYGNVVVENGGELRIKANEAILTNGVKVKTGGKLVISK